MTSDVVYPAIVEFPENVLADILVVRVKWGINLWQE